MLFSRVISGGIALAVGCLLVFSAPVAAGPKVAAVQVALKRIGLYNATVDGVRGPLTKAAIVHFQRRRGLAVDGVVGPQTRRAFGKRGRPAFGSRTMKRGDRGWDVAAMQYILARRGYPPGAIDAVFGPMTDTALRNFQRAYGLRRDGLAGPQTISALRHGRASRGAPGGTTPVSGPVRLLRPGAGPIGDGFGAPREGGRTHTGIDFPVAVRDAHRRRGRRGRGVRGLEHRRLREPRGGPAPARLHHLVRAHVPHRGVRRPERDRRHDARLRGLDGHSTGPASAFRAAHGTPCRSTRCRICWRRGDAASAPASSSASACRRVNRRRCRATRAPTAAAPLDACKAKNLTRAR